MEVLRQFVGENPPRPCAEQVIPYALAERMLARPVADTHSAIPYALAERLITPSGWTLTEETREVRLPRG